MEVSGTTVLLTGATGGLGQAIARKLAAHGAHLVLTGRRADVLEPLAAETRGRAIAVDLSEASEVLDDRIDEFRQILQDAMGLDDAAFGNPSLQSPSEIIAVGRIASDTCDSAAVSWREG